MQKMQFYISIYCDKILNIIRLNRELMSVTLQTI